MGTGQHRGVCIVPGQRADGVDHAVDRWQHVVPARVAQHLGVGEIVDVLGGGGEMDELADRSDLVRVLDLVPQIVFNGLDVVVGGLFYRLDLLALADIEIIDQLLQERVGKFGKRRDLGDLGLGGQRLQPADLHDQPVADQPVLAAEFAQPLGLVGVAAIDRRNRGQRGQLHGHGHASVAIGQVIASNST